MQLTRLGDLLSLVENKFESSDLYYGHGTDNPWDDAVSIACYVLDIPPDSDASALELPVAEPQKNAILALAHERIQKRLPVPYLTHQAWFAGLKFYVDQRVIIPRSPFAELIDKDFNPWIGDKPVRRILDLCTGSGCIAIQAALMNPLAQVDAVDISQDALEVAKKNIQLHNCQEKVRLIHSDLFAGCEGQRYDIIISNPPYVPTLEMQNLPKEYHWEPSLALEAGNDGLDIVKRILKEAPNYLTENGLLLVEVGNAAEALQNQFPQVPFIWLEFENGGEGVFLLFAEDKACWQAF